MRAAAVRDRAGAGIGRPRSSTATRSLSRIRARDRGFADAVARSCTPDRHWPRLSSGHARLRPWRPWRPGRRTGSTTVAAGSPRATALRSNTACRSESSPERRLLHRGSQEAGHHDLKVARAARSLLIGSWVGNDGLHWRRFAEAVAGPVLTVNRQHAACGRSSGRQPRPWREVECDHRSSEVAACLLARAARTPWSCKSAWPRHRAGAGSRHRRAAGSHLRFGLVAMALARRGSAWGAVDRDSVI